MNRSLRCDIVAQGHGGTLAVESEEGEGVAFRVVLPAQQSRTQVSAEAHDHQPEG